MDCERFDKNSMDLLYGELDELTEAATLRHLHHCTRCREIWGHLRTTRELSQLPQEEPPTDLAMRIVEAEKVAHRSLPVRERFSRTISVLADYAMRPQLAMAALLVLMVGSGLIFVRATPTGKTADGMRVVERGTPSVEVRNHEKNDSTLVFGGDPEPKKMSGSDLKKMDPTKETAPASPEATTLEEIRQRQRAAYSDAMTAYQQGRYAEAERLFSEVASAGGEQSASAALHEGHAARNGSGCQRAARIYDEVANRSAGGTIAYEASWHAASCYRAMGQTARAIGHYKKLATQGAFAERAQQALSELSPKPSSVNESETAAAASSGPEDEKAPAANGESGKTETTKSNSEAAEAPPKSGSVPQQPDKSH